MNIVKKYLFLCLIILLIVSGCVETQAEKAGWDQDNYEKYSDYYDWLLFNYNHVELNQSEIHNVRTKGYLNKTEGKNIEEWLIDIPKDKNEFEKTWYLAFYYFQKVELEHKKLKVCSPDDSYVKCLSVNKQATKEKKEWLQKAAEYRQKIEEMKP